MKHNQSFLETYLTPACEIAYTESNEVICSSLDGNPIDPWKDSDVPPFEF